MKDGAGRLWQEALQQFLQEFRCERMVNLAAVSLHVRRHALRRESSRC